MVTTIPTYALYGEQSEPSWENFFNVEMISLRSEPMNWKANPHIHSSLIQALFIQRGEVDVLMNCTQMRVRSPALILVPAQTVHGFEYLPGTEGMTITASQQPMESVIGLLAPNVLQLMHNPCVIPLGNNPDDLQVIHGFFQSLQKELQKPMLNQTTMCVSIFISILVHLTRINGQAEEQQKFDICSRKATQINKFLLLVEKRFRQRLTVNDYSEMMGMSPGHLSRLCRITLGMSSLDVINMRVIQEAQQELVYTSKTIKQLAAFLGFNDEAYFTRFFHKHTGVSPGQYRELALRKRYTEEMS
ncbi:AraC family transcriptional regulator [Citrobacter sp. NCU1]|uniref:helix-turn-helix domain-containing protein n=1 Tax=Citrobacter sp. NCU1 TaxID=2026683 RepID=UPI001391741F|nr:helix-turn-helix domain-containing protein [Citrobacter sp. NCU1]NDO83669.1 AraC family transcriptional regulator [Citrobacter sp. NCU1]